MGTDFTAEQVDNAANVGEIVAVVKEEIGCLKVCPMKEMLARLCVSYLPPPTQGCHTANLVHQVHLMHHKINHQNYSQ